MGSATAVGDADFPPVIHIAGYRVATELEEPRRGWRYHSGPSIYVERLREGRLIVAQSGWIPL